MNTSPTSLLFAGAVVPIVLLDGSVSALRVRTMPARHLLELLDLFDVGKEAELLLRVASHEDGSPVTPEEIDNLDDVSHLALVTKAHELNFTRAVSYAERQIASGTGLHPLKKRIAAAMIAPIRDELTSLMSLATTAKSPAAAATPP